MRKGKYNAMHVVTANDSTKVNRRNCPNERKRPTSEYLDIHVDSEIQAREVHDMTAHTSNGMALPRQHKDNAAVLGLGHN